MPDPSPQSPVPSDEDGPRTARDEAAEPSGEEDPANEAQREEETERSEAVEASPQSPAPSPQDGAAGEGEEAESEDELAKVVRERDEYLDLARRAQADFENYRKRAAREAAAAGERAKSGLVRELLPVVDNLERALATVEGAREAGHPPNREESEQHLAEGVRLVYSELIAVLERHGVEPFDPRGQSFDPTLHEALSTRSEDGAEPGVILDVVEKGYKANGSVLRPARVVVAG